MNKKWYDTKEEAERNRKKSQVIYFNPENMKYYIVDLRKRKSFWSKIFGDKK